MAIIYSFFCKFNLLFLTNIPIMPVNPSANIPQQVASKYLTVNDIKLHYLEAGEKEVVLMLHGFPTSAYLWRNIMPKLAETHRVIALDLPGYGKSEKPLTVSYSLNFYSELLTAFLKQLNIRKVNLAVHDLGGPVGLLWAVRHPESIHRLVFLNTLVYPNFSWAVILFTLALKAPLAKDWVTSPKGIAWAMRFGVENKDRIKSDLLEQYQNPFKEKSARQALIKSASNISLKAFKEIEKKLPLFTIPVQVIYGKNDRILPKVAMTMQRIKKDLPQTEITELPNCGHFLQEDEPAKISALLSTFLNK